MAHRLPTFMLLLWGVVRSLLLRERISSRYIARLIPFLEPVHPLCTCAVCERFGDYYALGLLLKTVIADRIRRAQGLFDIPFIQQIFSRGVMCPYACKKIGL